MKVGNYTNEKMKVISSLWRLLKVNTTKFGRRIHMHTCTFAKYDK